MQRENDEDRKLSFQIEARKKNNIEKIDGRKEMSKNSRCERNDFAGFQMKQFQEP